MAQLISVKLSRFDGSPWGFRLQGGKDFGTPLIVQKVNGGSPAEAAGLKAGDAVIRVNSTDMFNLRHKDAQDVIVRAGNNFELTVQRGGSTWKPHVSPVSGTMPSPSPVPGNITPVTKTSLAAKKQDGPLIGSGHNFSPKPFLNGTGDGSIKSIVNKQYNSPVGIYSEETIAETLSAQAEVLAGGVLGVNFKKNEKNYNAENSEVFKMVQEADKEPKTPEPAEPPAQSGVVMPSSPALTGLRPVSAPETKPQPSTPQTSLPPGQNICAECERLIVGVFVRIKDKNLHVECFKCSTCGTSLKNVGYYNINNKLYCDIHAKLVARQNAPAGMVPITVPPGGKAPASTISSALANAPMSPPLSNHGSSPLPFSACNRTSPDHGFYQARRSSYETNGYIRNGECNGESKTFTSTITIQTGRMESTRLGSSPVEPPNLRSVQAPPSNNLIGPKPFSGGSSTLPTNLSSPPLINSGNSTLPRAQTQTAAGLFSTLPKPNSSPFGDSTESHEQSAYYCCELVEETKTERKPTSVRAKTRNWPPPRPTEDPSYPTASPLYIDPNPALDRRGRQAVKEKKASIEACELVCSRRSESCDREVERVYCRHQEDPMDRVSCPGPVYKKVELVETSTGRQSRSEITSRPSSTDSVRRSLTPTKIVQPIPKPWTATVSTGGSLYEQSYGPPEPPKVCKKFHHREICQRERICERSQPYREEHRAYRSEVCRREQTICDKPPLPIPNAPIGVCATTPAQEEVQQQFCSEVTEGVTDTKTMERDPDLSGIVPADVQSDTCPMGFEGEHDLITETAEEDVDGMHIMKTTTFEKTVTMPPERPKTPEVEETTEQRFMRATSTHIERECQNITEQKTVVESAEVVTSAVDVQQMLEQAKRDEEERKRQEEEEERRKQEEEERRKREEEERRRRAEEERKRQEEERRRQEEEEERRQRHVTFDEEDVVVEEVREQPLGRTVVREERVTEEETDTPGRTKLIKETYEEITEEVLVQERVKKREITDETRKKSLRDQVEVHRSIRDQQAPEKRQGSLQERRLCTKIDHIPQEVMESSKKHVQFMKQTESGPRPIPHSALQNSTPKEWKSEMVNALTTAPDRPFTPVSTSTSIKEVFTEETIFLDHRHQPRQPPQEDIRPISPFQQALMIAPERPYTPLCREIGPGDRHVAGRSFTPSIADDKEGYCPPADILYGEGRFKDFIEEPPKQMKPRPLPTPPPDFRLRDRDLRSVSPCASRPETPSAKITAHLKKPDTIPFYQKNLVAMKKDAVESHAYVPSRTPTPTAGRCKSPAQGPPDPPPCFRAQAPRIKDEFPPKFTSVQFPTKKSVSYKIEEDTDEGHRKAEYAGSRTVDYTEKETEEDKKGVADSIYARFQEKRFMTSEETSEEKKSIVKRALEITENLERCEKTMNTAMALPEAEPPYELPMPTCAIEKTSQKKPCLPCPSTAKPREKPCAKPVYLSSTEVKHVRYDTPSPKPPCPVTGVTVLPCKAHSDKGTKAGVVVVPCEGSQASCKRSGVCVVPTSDRSGVCVSPCFGMKTGSCGQPSGSCGRESACDIELPPNCPGSGICVAPCSDGSVCVAPCSKPGQQTRTSSRAGLPFPQIPFPFEDDPVCPQPACPPASCPVKTDNFQPIHKPRTNLSGQLARLTCKTAGQSVPTVQLYKPQPQSQPQTQVETETRCEYQSYRSTQSSYCCSENRCEGNGQCETQTRCLDGLHCSPSDTQKSVDPPNLSSHPDLGTSLGGPVSKGGSFAGSSAPKRGRGILNQGGGAGSRVPLCGHCNSYVRGPFITALGQIWCPEHFVCVNTQCRRPLQDIGFVEEKGQLYCEYCFERFIAPPCCKCNNKIKGDCLNAIGKHFHPECFKCAYCGKLFGNSPFFLEEGLPYCEADWNELFTTKCFACGFPVEVGDRWVEALNNNYHSQCFNCTMCKKNLEGQSFYAKGGRPFCKNHAR